MKLTSIELNPDNSSSVAIFSFRDSKGVNPYNVKNITGLDADEITPRFYTANKGISFFEQSLQKREIVLQIGLNPNIIRSESYSDLRDNLYRMIASSRTGMVQVEFKNGATIVAILRGFILKTESPQFEKTQEVQITIGNFEYPMLKAPNPVSIDASGLSTANAIITDNLSTAPHGLVFSARVTSRITDPIIFTEQQGTEAWDFILQPVDGFNIDDEILFSSEYNNKYVNLRRNGMVIPIVDTIVPGSIWPMMFPGDNVYSWKNHSDLIVWDRISYYSTYWGV